MAQKDPNSPATTSVSYDLMEPKWDMISTLLGGTMVLRSKGATYLPKHAQETPENYQERLKQNVLFNMFELTLDSLVGRPFARPVRHDDVPDNLVEILKDIDLAGNNITVFARKWFREGIAKGFAHVLVDFPHIPPEERENRTLADDMRQGLRPYFNFISPENIIFAESKKINGREMLTHIRIKEYTYERVGFAEVEKKRIRVLQPGEFFLYEERTTPKGEKVWVVVDSGYTHLPFIPLVTFYASKRDSLMLAKPPLEDLAFLNIRHWQSNSDQINILTVARFPMLAVSGAADTTGDTMKIGPRLMLGTKRENGKFYYVEHDGRAIEAGRQELLDLEEMMASYGAEFLKRRPGNATATARALDSAEAVSPLQDMVLRFNDVLNVALDYLAQWTRTKEYGQLEVNEDFKNDYLSEAQLKALLDLREKGDISRRGILMALMKSGVLPDSFDMKQDLEDRQTEPDLEPVGEYPPPEPSSSSGS